MKQDNSTSWQIPEVPETIRGGEGRGPEELALRAELAGRVAGIAERQGWSMAEVARRIGMPNGTFSQWFSGRYDGRFDSQNAKVETWLDTVDEMEAIAASIPVSPARVKTRIGDEITDMLAAAHMMPTLTLTTCEAGMGKTFSARAYQAAHANCWLATITPYTRTVHGVLQTVARAVGLTRFSNGELVGLIGERISRKSAPTLLIVDEAQNLIDDAINQLRHFCDEYQCGVALMGNTESYRRFAQWSDGPKYGQLRRRIFKRMRREKPYKADLIAFISAWGIEDPRLVEFLVGVGMKPGAFGQIDMTVKLAKMSAIGAGRELTLADLKAAWKNRDVEIGGE